MTYYYDTQNVMRNYLKKEDIITSRDNILNEKQVDEIFKILREMHQRKRNIGIADTVFYNFIRNKPLFYGVNKIRQNHYCFLNNELNDTYIYFYGNNKDYYKKILEILNDDKEIFKKIINEFKKGLNKFEKDTSKLKTVDMISK